MGKINCGQLPFLSHHQADAFNTVGYTGKNKVGKNTTRQQFLNGLNNGKFIVEQTKLDNGDFFEKFTIIRAYIK